MQRFKSHDGNELGYTVRLIDPPNSHDIDARELKRQLDRLDTIRATVEAWRDEAKQEAGESHEHARSYIMAESRMKCYQNVLDLLDGEETCQ